MKIVVVGSGAIGCLFGGLLSKGGHDVWMVDKNKEVVETIKEKGICIVTDGETLQHIQRQSTLNPREIESCDFILLCVKCFDTEEAVQGISHLIKGEIPLLTLQTGMGNIKTASSIIPEKNILGGVTYNGATVLSPGRIRYVSPGETYIGEIDGKETERVHHLLEVFKGSGIETKISDNIRGHIWSKAIIYSGINPLTAILRIKNGQLLDKIESINLLREIIKEGIEIAERSGRRLIYDEPYESLFYFCKKTSENLSPMLQDILNKRKTEIDALNGAIVEKGREIGIHTPVNRAIRDIIKLLEKWGGCE
ncbi:MAG: 2-dehydropantoate 2-reductase [Nitrospinae bacterium]|nr:2-dehydropantoate 2-reductase [Nitrospinota bacterium]